MGAERGTFGLAGWLAVSFAAAAALATFGAQLGLNALWAVILAVVPLFWREDWRAGALMMPYLVWFGFASCLNFALWRLNDVPR